MNIPELSIKKYQAIIKRKQHRIISIDEAREEYRRLLLGFDAILRNRKKEIIHDS